MAASQIQRENIFLSPLLWCAELRGGNGNTKGNMKKKFFTPYC